MNPTTQAIIKDHVSMVGYDLKAGRWQYGNQWFARKGQALKAARTAALAEARAAHINEATK